MFFLRMKYLSLFRKLKIVLIDLVRGQDDPQLIFESLNSTGVDLTAGDLIRNYILMDLEPFEQEKLYKDYWIHIEKLAGDVAEFIRIYLIFKTKTSIKKDEVYIAFKKASLELFDKEFLRDFLQMKSLRKRLFIKRCTDFKLKIETFYWSRWKILIPLIPLM